MRKLYDIARICPTYEEFVVVLEKNKEAEPKKIVDNILMFTFYRIADIRSKSRLRDLVDVRMIISYVLFKNGYTHQEIGELINRDRCTSLYHCNKVVVLLEHDADFKKLFNKIVGY